jgi:hypothetical protein
MGTTVQLMVIRWVWLNCPLSVVFGYSYPNGYRIGTGTAVVQLCMVDSMHLGVKIIIISTVH